MCRAANSEVPAAFSLDLVIHWEMMQVNKLLQYSAAALLLGVGATGVAMADSASTSGGLKIKTDDGKFEFGIGGRLQLDTVIFDDDKLAALGLQPNGQAIPTPNPTGLSSGTTSGTFFRRTYLTLTGKLYDFKFKFENDFSAGASPASFREVWIGHQVLGGDLIVGQHKPFRGIEELTSSNEILLLERPFTNNVLFASGGNRQFQPGVFYKLPINTDFGYFFAQASVYNANHALGTPPGQGFGTSERLTWLIVGTDNLKLHLGVWGGEDEFSKTASGNQSVNYAGRNSGGSQVIGVSQLIAPSLLGSQETFYGAEAAAAWGSAFVQSEWARATYQDARGPGLDDSLVSWYVQGSYFITGEKKGLQEGSRYVRLPESQQPVRRGGDRRPIRHGPQHRSLRQRRRRCLSGCGSSRHCRRRVQGRSVDGWSELLLQPGGPRAVQLRQRHQQGYGRQHRVLQSAFAACVLS